MKKLSYFRLLVLPLLLSSCGTKGENLTNSPLFFSEFHSFSDSSSRALEIYNSSSLDINLSSYSVIIDQTSGQDYVINLTGTIEALSTFVIVKSTSSSEILALADLISDDLHFNGMQAISLKRGKSVLDVIGTPSFTYDYATNLDMCRKLTCLKGRKTYEPYDWIRYASDDTSHLGQVDDVISEKLLDEGPRLTEEVLSLPFASSDSLGGGGAIAVTLSSKGDGDTTGFNFGYSDPYVTGYQSVRYLCIDTPEVQHESYINEQPWGVAAKKYNNEILSQGKKFLVQSFKNYSLKENYGRVLGYVWVAMTANPNLEDYVCLNYLMIKEGYSTLRYVKDNQKYDETRYLGISYCNYMRNAEIVAEELGLKVHGEKDPSFDY